MQHNHQGRPPVHWISHRGYHIQFVENSKNAFDAARSGGFTHLETDLRITKDGVLVLCHDPDLKRVGGPKKLVSELTAAELDSIRLRDASKVMHFSEFYQLYGASSLVTLDIKPEGGMNTVKAFLAWVKARGAEDWVTSQVTFLLWKAAHEDEIRKVFPQARYYARREECLRAGLALVCGVPALAGIKPGRTYAVPPSFLGLSLYQKKFIAAIQSRQGKAVAFLPETPAEVQAAIEAGVDEILTNGKKV